MPFLYDVCNVELQLYAKGLAWSRGGKHLQNLFLFPLCKKAETEFSMHIFYSELVQ